MSEELQKQIEELTARVVLMEEGERIINDMWQLERQITDLQLQKDRLRVDVTNMLAKRYGGTEVKLINWASVSA
jgi:hypothetical protein